MAKQVRKKNEGQKGDELDGLPTLNRNAAGIDVGSVAHDVAVPVDRDAEPKMGKKRPHINLLSRVYA